MGTYVPPLPDSRPLLARVSDIWQKKLLNLPVDKDLPRLAGGFEIVDGDTQRMLYKEKKDTPRNITCRDIIWTIAVFFPDTSDKEEVDKLQKEKKKQREKVRARESKRSLRDTHDEREIDEDDDDDDDDDDDRDSLRRSRVIRKDKDLYSDDSDSDDCDGFRPGFSEDKGPIPLENLFANKIAATYSKIIKPTGDLAVAMRKFFQSETFDHEGKLARILKCIQQEIICPPVMDLRMNVYSKFSYKDVKGTWRVRIELYFEDDDSSHENIDLTSSGLSPFPRRRPRRSSNINPNAEPKSPTPVFVSGGRRKKSVPVSEVAASDTYSKDQELLCSTSTASSSGSSGSKIIHMELKPSSPIAIAGAKRFLKRTHSLPAFEGNAAIRKHSSKVIATQHTDPNLSSPNREKSSEATSPTNQSSSPISRFVSEGRKRLKESSGAILEKSPAQRTRRLSKDKDSSSTLSVLSQSSAQMMSQPLPDHTLFPSKPSISSDSDRGEKTPRLDDIKYRPVKKIRVLHRKREQSSNEDPTTHFEFEWELALTFGPDLELIQEATLQLVDVSTCDGFAKEKHENLLGVLKDYMSEEFPFVSLWKKPLSKSPFYKEMQYNTKVLEIFDQQGREVYKSNHAKPNVHNMIVILSSLLNEKTELSAIEQKFYTNGAKTDHARSKAAKAFIGSLVSNDEDIALTRLLRATSKNMVVPASSKIKNILTPIVKEIKDVREPSRIVVSILSHVVTVSHSQKNTCFVQNANNANSDCVFQFEWTVTLTFSPSVEQLLSVQLEIVEYSFSEGTLDASKEKILSALASFMTPETLETSSSTIGIPVVIKSLSTVLARLPADKLIVSDPSLPDGEMSALTLLELLKETLA